MYKFWYLSPPFDMGASTANSFTILDEMKSGYAAAAKQASAESNQES